MQAVLIKWNSNKTNYQVINYNGNYPTIDPVTNPIIPQVDVDGYEWLIPYAVSVQQEYDERIWELTLTIGPSQLFHPLYPQVHQWRMEQTLVKRNNDDIIANIKSTEASKNAQLLAAANEAKTTICSMNALNRRIQGITLTSEELTCLNRLAEVNEKVLRNADIAAGLIDQVNNGTEPNIDGAPWEIDDLTVCNYPYNE